MMVREGERMLGLYLSPRLELLIVPVAGLVGVYERIGIGRRFEISWPSIEECRTQTLNRKAYRRAIVTLC
jgi:hypothetical protein